MAMVTSVADSTQLRVTSTLLLTTATNCTNMTQPLTTGIPKRKYPVKVALGTFQQASAQKDTSLPAISFFPPADSMIFGNMTCCPIHGRRMPPIRDQLAGTQCSPVSQTHPASTLMIIPPTHYGYMTRSLLAGHPMFCIFQGHFARARESQDAVSAGTDR